MIKERMMKVLVQTLREGNHSMVVAQPLAAKDDSSKQEQQTECILTFDGRGISDLYRLLHENPDVLQGAQLADKVVGKGAAALMALGKVKEVYAEVISEPALSLLEGESIRTTYGKLVPHIINREGTGLCPVEARCMNCQTPKECLVQIETFLNEIKIKK